MIEADEAIGNFIVKSVLGEGGAATVYLARDRSLERDVAIKVLLPTTDPSLFQLFRDREARIHARLDHPNILRVYAFDYDPDHDTHFMVMEYASQGTLEDVYTRGQITRVESVNMMSDVCKALAFAHSEGIIHRDIKPKNILVTRSGVVKLSDFGIARDSNDIGIGRTLAGVMTEQYCSPEQRKQEQLDSKTDIYSLGLVFAHMLTKEPLPKHVSAKDALQSSCPDLPVELVNLIASMIAERRQDRPTAEDVLAQLSLISLGLTNRADNQITQTDPEPVKPVQPEPKPDPNQLDRVSRETPFPPARQNDFIAYLNSLHNLGPSGANALAESQALSPYFGEMYQPFPIAEKIAQALTDGVDRVIILTGHAGDGKSTVALDIFKQLRKLDPGSPLVSPLKDREDISDAGVTIVKDMSELSASRRKEWITQAFNELGSWLIVSNTGPLLKSLVECKEALLVQRPIESEILELLNRDVNEDALEEHTMAGFRKELMIINLTRLDNINIGARVLTKVVDHSAWNNCSACAAANSCPIMQNRNALKESVGVVEQRVRWIYQRLNAYEKRLTLRQVLAQLTLGITGGMSCLECQQFRTKSGETNLDDSSFENCLFSESFFGYRAGKPWPEAEGLKAIGLVRREIFGGPISVDFERRCADTSGFGWATLPPSLKTLDQVWRGRAADAAGVRWRFASRRMTYIFGSVNQSTENAASVFLDSFLQSPSLRQLDQWRVAGKITVQSSKLKSQCLRVLLEVYSGFSAGQFQKNDTLYLTLRRPDRAVVQPTQVVIEALPFRDFDLTFDPRRQLPVILYQKGKAKLTLTLPLLDYIYRRDAGEIGNSLSPIHQAQLDWFHSELNVATQGSHTTTDEIELLRAEIDGEVHLHRIHLDPTDNRLELVQ